MPKYIYQRGGAPLLQWKQAAPRASRGADARSLGGYESYPGGQLVKVAGATVGQAVGSLGCGSCTGGLGSLAGSSLDGPTISMPLPRAGAPEPLPSIGAFEGTPAKLAVGGVLAFLAYKALKRR